MFSDNKKYNVRYKQDTGSTYSNNSYNRVFLGVCSRLSNITKINPIIFRLAFIVGSLFFVFPAIIIYIVLSLVLPNKK